MRRRKIALIRNSYAHDVGGAEKFPYLVATALDKEVYEPVVISANTRTRGLAAEYGTKAIWSPWLKFQNYSGIRIVLFPIFCIWQIVLFIWYVAIFLIHGFNVVHSQSRDDFIAATLAGRILGKKVVWTDHADLKYVYQNYSVWYKNPVGKLVFWCSKLAHTITLVSNNEKLLVEQSVGKELQKNYVVVHNGVADAANEFPHTKSNKIRFAATSRLVKAKGISELIEAFAALKNDAELHLYGDGPDEAEFKKLAKNNESIVFHGFTNNIYEALANTDVFVHPSYNEGFSVSIVEAAMMGRPVLACCVGGNPEIVFNGKNGYLVEVKNIPELRAAMQKFVTNPSLIEKMGSQSRNIYLNQFQFDQIVKNTFEKFYEK